MADNWQSKLTLRAVCFTLLLRNRNTFATNTEVHMKQLKRIACLSLVSVLFAASSLAEGAPASQFGVNNWPYRTPNSACGTTNQPQDCATATPAPVPSAQPTAAPKPTARPQPTVQPTAKPTAAPTNSGNLGDYTTVSVSAQEYSAWNLLNADREANGLAALPLDQELCRIRLWQTRCCQHGHAL